MDRRRFLTSGLAAMASAPLAAGGPRRRRGAPAERVIVLHMCGGPSTVDLLDPKPALLQRDGEAAPASFFATQKFAFTTSNASLVGSRHPFVRGGQSGIEVSSLLPEFTKVVDQVTLVRSMQTDQFNHAPAQLMMNCGSANAGRPSMGSWLSLAFDEAPRQVPSYSVLFSGTRPRFGESPWVNGFLPGRHRGVKLADSGELIPFLGLPPEMTRQERRQTLDLARRLGPTDEAQHELAFLLQASLPEASDLREESAASLALYGATPEEPSFANNCLMARRFVERGARCVYLADFEWDHHGTSPGQDLGVDLPIKCQQTDRAVAGLLTDLDQRGLLDSTIVVWGGEFGRTPFEDGTRGFGRDHHPRAFSIWLAGGGFHRGKVYGATDELGWDVVEDPVTWNDVQATILHQLGFNHFELTWRFGGRDFRLTDVAGRVIQEWVR